MEEKLFKRASNYGARVDWVLKAYDAQRGLVHGFQKDVIQNAIGARISNSNYDGWKCSIYIFRNSIGTFCVVEDFGTVGLTGENFSVDELEKMTRNKETIDPYQRLARISVDNSSGGDPTSPGLYGVGKTLYVAASNNNCNYFDSLAIKEGYRCNVNDANEMLYKAKEGDDAKEYIKEHTGLEPINHVGTRFIITNPKSDIIDAIEGPNHEMLLDAEETWWRAIVRMQDQNQGIFIGGIRAQTPDCYRFDESKEFDVKDAFFTKTPKPIDDGLRYKKIGFFINKNLPDNLCGFYYYRRGMKIGKIDISDYDSLINKPYYGFVELEPNWEEQLAKYEDQAHYDCTRTGKNTKVYQDLKYLVRNTVQEQLEKWGYDNNKENEDKYLSQLVEHVKEDLSDLLAENGFENIGKGNSKPQLEIRLSDVWYPHTDEENLERSVFSGEEIHFSFNIFNRTNNPINVTVFVNSYGSDGSVLSHEYEKSIKISPETPFTENVVFKPNENNSVLNGANELILSAQIDRGTSATVTRKLVYYFGCKTVIRPLEDFQLNLASYHFPNESTSGRRVDTDESVTNVSYSMVSQLHKPVDVVLKISTLNYSNNNDYICSIMEKRYTLPPDGEEMVTEPFNIVFDKETYFPALRKGIIVVRAKMVLAQDLPDEKNQMDASTKLKVFDFRVFFNKPEKAGPDIDISYRDFDQSDHRMARISDKSRTGIEVNTSYPEFLACKDLLAKNEYLTRVCLREAITLYASRGALDNMLMSSQEPLSNFEFFQKLEDKIEDLWYKQCQKI